MNDSGTPQRSAKAAASALALIVGATTLPTAVSAQDTAAPSSKPSDGPPVRATELELNEVVVTGFRASINSAVTLKKEDTGIVDTILAEDIGKFPDANLAESMQRVPGVALSRGDGGEGKNISVRGLGAGFTRVRVNGMEGSSQTGASDIFGAGNRGRSFDFNVFASELFNSLAVRKTTSADTEEGSLGATVDLQTARPLDYTDDFVFAASAQGSYNDLSEETSPRATALVSQKFMDGTFGALASIAYTERTTREEGYSAVNILRSTDDGGFCSPLGVTPQAPANNPAKGTDAANCATGVPRTSDPAAYALVNRANVFHPRIPRYVRSEQEYERVGATGSLQWQPGSDTKVSLDALYAGFEVDRYDNFIAGLSFGRNANANGKPNSSIVAGSVTPDGTLEYGLFNGVDVRSEGLLDHFESTFEQLTLSGTHKFSGQFEIDGLIGKSRSEYDNPLRTTISIDSNNVNGFSYDFRNGERIPEMNFGIDVNNPANFVFAPTLADGTVRGLVVTRSLKTKTDNSTAELNALYSPTQELRVRFGTQYREGEFESNARNRTSANAALVPALPDGTTLASLTRLIDGFGSGLDGNIPSSWLAADFGKFNDVFHITDNTGIFAQVGPEGGIVQDNLAVEEKITTGYSQLEFDTERLPIRIRGNLGVRYVSTDQHTMGYVPVGTGAVQVTSDRTYHDWLPSLNVAFELTDDLLLRASAAKVIARPELGQITPGLTAFNSTLRTMSGGNPDLDPIRAKTYDLSLEYYFNDGGILSVGAFYKDIDSYIQTLTEQRPYSETGLPNSLLDGTTAAPTDIFTVTRFTNTPGGPLKGAEFNYQQPFYFLPSWLSNFGVLMNYTYVESEITYFLGNSQTTTTTNDLIGLSKNAYSATLYYEAGPFSTRATASYRDNYLRAVPSGGPDSDVLGNLETMYVDASASYQITDTFRVSLEAQNLTDEHNTLYIDSRREDTQYDTHSGRTYTLGVSYRY